MIINRARNSKVQIFDQPYHPFSRESSLSGFMPQYSYEKLKNSMESPAQRRLQAIHSHFLPAVTDDPHSHVHSNLTAGEFVQGTCNKYFFLYFTMFIDLLSARARIKAVIYRIKAKYVTLLLGSFIDSFSRRKTLFFN